MYFSITIYSLERILELDLWNMNHALSLVCQLVELLVDSGYKVNKNSASNWEINLSNPQSILYQYREVQGIHSTSNAVISASLIQRGYNINIGDLLSL